MSPVTTSGTGSATIGYMVAMHDGPQRQATLTIAGIPFVVTQASGCSIALAPTSRNVSEASGTTTFDVVTAAGCGFTTSESTSWITSVTPSGTGMSTVTVGYAANVSVARNDAPRELTIEPDVVVLTCADGSIELECAGGAAPRTAQYDEYELELVNRRSAAVAWRSPRQVPPSGALLSFVIPDPAAFGNGDYDMIVRGHSPDHEEVVGRFWLRITEQ